MSQGVPGWAQWGSNVLGGFDHIFSTGTRAAEARQDRRDRENLRRLRDAVNQANENAQAVQRQGQVDYLNTIGQLSPQIAGLQRDARQHEFDLAETGADNTTRRTIDASRAATDNKLRLGDQVTDRTKGILGLGFQHDQAMADRFIGTNPLVPALFDYTSEQRALDRAHQIQLAQELRPGPMQQAVTALSGILPLFVV